MDKITIKKLIEWVNENNIPLDTEIDALVEEYPCTLKRIIYCAEYNTITMNPMGTHVPSDISEKVTAVLD